MKAWVAGLGVALALTACRGRNTEEPGVPPIITVTRDAPPVTYEASTEEILAASGLPSLVPKALADDPLGVTVHRLSNGMTVYISTDRQEPSFYGWIVVRAGSRHDPAESTGLAHYLEHMLLFKGSDELGTIDHAAEKPHLDRIRALYRELHAAATEQERERVLGEIDAQTQEVAKHAIPNEIGRMYTGLGFTGMNAFTNKDRTYYVQKVPANRLEAWATVEAERFSDPVFRLFFPELEAVYEEKNRGLDSSWRRMWELTGEGLFPEHPLGTQTTLGEVEHLKTPAFDEMVAFHRRWYVPNNMAILLVGDVDESALPLLEEKFSRLAPRPLEEPPPGELTGPKGRIVKEVLSRDEELVRVAWRTVAAGHPDAPVLRVLDRLLEDARTGLLNVELEQPRKVQWANSNLTLYREGGNLSIDAARREGQGLEEVERLVRETVAKLADVTDAQVEAAKLHTSIERKLRAEFPQVTVNRLVDTFVQHREWKDVVAEDRRVESVTRAEVVAAANKYLGEASVVIFRRSGDPDVPKVTKPGITPLNLDATRQSELAKKVTALPARPLEPQWVRRGTHYDERTLPAGPLLASQTDRNDVFTLAYAWDLGYRQQKLLCEALRVHKLSGTSTRTAAQLQEELYALGSTIETRCGDDNTQVFIRGIDGNLEATLRLLDAWFGDPKIEASVLEQHVKSTIERRDSELDSEGSLTSALAEHAQFGKRSFWKIRPSSAQLRRMKPKQAHKAVVRLFDHAHRTTYAGPRPIDEVASLVARGTKHRKVDRRPARRYEKPKKTTIYFLHREQAKANVAIVFASEPVDMKDPASIPQHEVFSRYIGGGTGSITFREIRTKRSLAYAVGARVSSGRAGDDVMYQGSMQNQSDKVAEAVPALLQTLQRREIEPGRFAEARGAIDERYRGSRVNPRFVPFTVDDWMEDGFDEDPRPARHRALASVSAEDLSARLEVLTQRPAIITIVGDEANIDLSALERDVGPVERLEAADLFTP